MQRLCCRRLPVAIGSRDDPSHRRASAVLSHCLRRQCPAAQHPGPASGVRIAL